MRVTFRAQFSGPKDLLNPMGLNLSKVVVTVEVFRRGDSWRARECDTKRKAEFEKLGTGPTHGNMKDTVAGNFEKQLTPWLMHDALDGKLLDPDKVEEDPKGNFTEKLETHIAGENQVGMPGNQFKTACGQTVPAHQIKSKRGQTAPDCKVCRVTWAKTKTSERIA